MMRGKDAATGDEMSSEFRRVVIEGYHTGIIRPPDEAEAIACGFRGRGFDVSLEDAPDPYTLRHGARGHECSDENDSCWRAAMVTRPPNMHMGHECRGPACTEIHISPPVEATGDEEGMS